MSPPAAGQGNSCNNVWPLVFLILSIVVVVLTFVSVIITLVYATTLNGVILGVYCLLFSLLGLSAELLQFSVMSEVIMVWMKYFYILLFYRPRGIYYILFGVLLLGTGILNIVAGTITIVLGILMLVVSLVVSLPETSAAGEGEGQRSGPTSGSAGRGTSPASKSRREPNV
ncbi:hypothetical protein, conserved [Leishmania tarentolae]|uniref:COPI associated protein n=1 Tax=Leishmania tarentolae TaxID=5689 RepID=A0A640KDW9_LEITA|nr:hypothetical protein, conserved [Leishmania tarentolae]